MVAGQKCWSRSMAAKWVEPESNQPSSVSVSCVKPLALPQCGQVKPSGRMSAASMSNHAFEPFFSNRFATASIVSSVQTGLPQSLQ